MSTSSSAALPADILTAFPGSHPAGQDVLPLNEWFLLREARRQEQYPDPSNKNAKRADWREAERIALKILTACSKDLRVAAYLAEAKTRLYGFEGLRDGLMIVNGLIESFWDSGLHPATGSNVLKERARCIESLNSLLCPAILLTPLLDRADGGENFSYDKYSESRRVGYEKDTYTNDGDGGYSLQVQRQTALDNGEISAEIFDAGLTATSWEREKRILTVCEEASCEFKRLDDLLDAKYKPASEGNVAKPVSRPILSSLRVAIGDVTNLLREFAETKKPCEPEKAPEPARPVPIADASDAHQAEKESFTDDPEQPMDGPSAAMPVPPVTPAAAVVKSSSNGYSGSWPHAEELLRCGEISRALATMRELSAQECRRAQFMRRLSLAEFCLDNGRESAAVSILEDLDSQIEEFRLDRWESPELIGKIWGTLFQLYRSDDVEEKSWKYYRKLCQLDPWQALYWSENQT